MSLQDSSPLDPHPVHDAAALDAPAPQSPPVWSSSPMPPSMWAVPATPARPPTSAPHTAGAGRQPGLLGTAFVAAVLSSLLTLTVSFAVFRGLEPAVGSPAPGTSGPDGGAVASAAAASSIAASGLEPAPDSSSATITATARVIPSVVTINTTSAGRRGATLSSSGSGFVFDPGGWILTNRHVVNGAQAVTVTFSDGRTLPGDVYGLASDNDLAVIKVEAIGLPAVSLGDSTQLALGQEILILGSPLGEYPNSVSTGVVSGLGRSIDITGVERLANLIQTDAAVNPGNSGGPMVDLAGRVIGVAVATSQAEGIAFGIPIQDARSVIAAALSGQPIP